ncbi:MAG: hypothetical protein WA446_09825 [Steroidobacteraceae bacterium]
MSASLVQPSASEIDLSWDEGAAKLRAAIEWVEKLGVDLRNTRFGRYLGEIERYASLIIAQPGPVSNGALLFSAVSDGQSLIAAHAQLAGRYDQFAATRVAGVARGTVSRSMETPDNSDARNICFELSTAAWLVSCGLALNAGDIADVAGDISEYYLLVQCKRVRSRSQVEKRGKEAVRQLRERLDNPIRPNMFGVVAFDITPMINPKFVLARGPTMSMQDLFNFSLPQAEKFSSDFSRRWREWKHPLIPVVLTRLEVLGAPNTANSRLVHYALQNVVTLYPRTRPHSGPFIRCLAEACSRGTSTLAGTEETRTALRRPDPLSKSQSH